MTDTAEQLWQAMATYLQAQVERRYGDRIGFEKRATGPGPNRTIRRRATDGLVIVSVRVDGRGPWHWTSDMILGAVHGRAEVDHCRLQGQAARHANRLMWDAGIEWVPHRPETIDWHQEQEWLCGGCKHDAAAHPGHDGRGDYCEILSAALIPEHEVSVEIDTEALQVSLNPDRLPDEQRYRCVAFRYCGLCATDPDINWNDRYVPPTVDRIEGQGELL